MSRFPSIGHTDFDTRQKLRNRFRNALEGAPPVARMSREGEVALDDIAVFTVLQNTHVYRNSGLAAFRSRYEQAAQNEAELPAFTEAVARGWFVLRDGHVVAPQAFRSYLHDQAPSFTQSLREVLHWSWDITFGVATQVRAAAPEQLLQLLDKAEADNFTIPVRTPVWVAARLWDKLRSPKLSEWIIKWRVLGAPAFTADDAWGADGAKEFAARAIHAVTSANLDRWSDLTDSERYARLRGTGDIRGVPVAPIAMPSHLLGKYLATRHPSGFSEDDEHCLSALWLVLINLARRDSGPLPYPESEPLVKLAQEHPSVLDRIETAAHQIPELLADLLMDPATAAIATYWVATWRQRARNEDEEESADRDQRVTAFTACTLALADHLRREALDCDEFGHLLIQLQAHRGRATPGAAEPSWVQRLQAVLDVFAKAPAPAQKVILEHVAREAEAGTGSPAFAVFLSAIGAAPAGIAASLGPALAQVYRKAIQPDSDVWDVELISGESARILVEAIHASGPEGQALLNAPLDVNASLAKAPDEQKYSVAHKMAQSTRTHIRLLARAISAYGADAPPFVVQALEMAIEFGAQEHLEKSQLTAFSGFNDSVHVWGRRQRSIASDLANALRSTDDAGQAKLVNALLAIDQPGVLAELSRSLPAALRPQILQRIDDLVPEVAGRAVMLTELQQTIRQLLAAGLSEPAELYIAHEQALLTGGPVPNRVVEQLRARLQLHVIKEEFDAILSSQVPQGLSEAERSEAQDSIDNYRGLAFLLSAQHRDAVQAAAIFKRLHDRLKSPTYAINLLAARINKLLPGNAFDKLRGPSVAAATTALEEAEKALPDGSLGAEDEALHRGNVASLQLALGRTSEARETLRRIDGAHASAWSVALDAVAMYRQGHPEEGLNLLRHAELRSGMDPNLEGARDYISKGADYIARAKTVTTENLLDSWRIAFQKFKEAPASTQAQVHVGTPGTPPLEELLTQILRDVLAAVAALSPTFKLHDKSANSEDAVNTLVRELLRAQLSRWHGWGVHDQSFGGFTPKGNMGERDGVIAQRTSELAIFEGLKYSRTSMEHHLKKVTAYSSCDLFFHVSYAYEKKPQNALKVADEVAGKPPAGLTLESKTRLPPLGNQPDGLVARYKNSSDRTLTVVFLVVDLLQYGQQAVVGAPGASVPAAPAP